jgi:hypothetical protein
MSTATALILIAAVVIVAIVALILYRKERSRKLRSHFGPEYERAFRQYGGAAKAEEALAARQKRMEKVKVHALTDDERDRFSELWHGVQSRFVDDPTGSIREADRLVTDVMVARGYPMADFDRRADDISVDYPHVVNNYRKAHEIAQSEENGDASTEDLRHAVVCYRKLFEELLEGHAAPRR